MQQRVVHQTVEVQGRLAQLGIDPEALAQVIKRGYVAFTLCTVNDPPLFPGFSAWAQTVRALREYLVPKGWRRCDENNYSLVINPTEDMANQTQLTFAFDEPEALAADEGDEPVGERMTWLLLVHRGEGEVRSELSLPLSMGTDGRIESWQERIILGSMPTDPTEIDITPPNPVMPDIEVDVKRRA